MQPLNPRTKENRGKNTLCLGHAAISVNFKSNDREVQDIYRWQMLFKTTELNHNFPKLRNVFWKFGVKIVLEVRATVLSLGQPHLPKPGLSNLRSQTGLCLWRPGQLWDVLNYVLSTALQLVSNCSKRIPGRQNEETVDEVTSITGKWVFLCKCSPELIYSLGSTR